MDGQCIAAVALATGAVAGKVVGAGRCTGDSLEGRKGRVLGKTQQLNVLISLPRAKT